VIGALIVLGVIYVVLVAVWRFRSGRSLGSTDQVVLFQHPQSQGPGTGDGGPGADNGPQ
jgi:hypothetical protein